MTDSNPSDLEALTQGGHPSLAQAAGYLRRQQAGLARRFGIRLVVLGPDGDSEEDAGEPASPVKKPPPDFGGGATRGTTPDAGGPTMNDALKALSRRDRGY